MRAVSLLSPFLLLSRPYAWVQRYDLACRCICRLRSSSGTSSRADLLSLPTSELERAGKLLQINMTTARSESQKSGHCRTASHPNADSRLFQTHLKRIRTAGRVGTKKFVDPCKVFFGNLNYTTTDSELSEWISCAMGLPSPMLLHSCKIVVDWKTSQSKGYGFCVFTDPMFATVCIEKCDGRALGGRRLKVSQGAKKQALNMVVVDGGVQEARDLNERVFQDAMSDSTYSPVEYPGLPDKCLSDINHSHNVDHMTTSGSNAFTTNRSQRRLSARGKKRSKPISKGFGS